MRFIWRFLIAFLAITGGVALASAFLGINFGHSNFWEYHGLLFLVFISFFPRITLLFAGISTGGILWWLSWLFAPRLLVAVLATFAYWNENPVLVVIAWLVAFGGESSEKYVMVRRSRPYWKGEKSYNTAKWVDAEIQGQKWKRD